MDNKLMPKKGNPVIYIVLLVVNFISSASDVISPVMPLKMISGFETVISRLDIIVADTEITISCLAIVLKGLSMWVWSDRALHTVPLVNLPNFRSRNTFLGSAPSMAITRR